MAIVRSIVEADDGSLSAESRPGVGSSFYVTVPIAEETAEEPWSA